MRLYDQTVGLLCVSVNLNGKAQVVSNFSFIVMQNLSFFFFFKLQIILNAE